MKRTALGPCGDYAALVALVVFQAMSLPKLLPFRFERFRRTCSVYRFIEKGVA